MSRKSLKALEEKWENRTTFLTVFTLMSMFTWGVLPLLVMVMLFSSETLALVVLPTWFKLSYLVFIPLIIITAISFAKYEKYSGRDC